jgi:hypothetical protein
VKDLDGEVLPALAEDVLHLLAQDLARAVVRIDDAVTDLELDVLKRLDVLQVL